MAASYIGKAAVFGQTASVTVKAPANCIGTLIIEEFSFKPQATTVDILEGSETKGRIIANKNNLITFRGIFTGTGIADAATQATRTPEIGDTITIVDSTDTEVAGDYAVTDAEKTASVSDAKRISVTCQKFLGTDITAAVSA